MRPDDKMEGQDARCGQRESAWLPSRSLIRASLDGAKRPTDSGASAGGVFEASLELGFESVDVGGHAEREVVLEAHIVQAQGKLRSSGEGPSSLGSTLGPERGHS